jgi:hypothetical protein
LVWLAISVGFVRMGWFVGWIELGLLELGYFVGLMLGLFVG